MSRKLSEDELLSVMNAFIAALDVDPNNPWHMGFGAEPGKEFDEQYCIDGNFNWRNAIQAISDALEKVKAGA